MKGGRRTGTAVAIDSQVRERLARTAASAKSEVRAALRARITLAATDGLANGTIARKLQVSVNTVRKWRGRFAAPGPDGLRDAERSKRPKIFGPWVRMVIVATATGMPPHPEVAWSHRALAENLRTQIAELQGRLREAETHLEHLNCPHILAVFNEAISPLRARDVCQALDHELLPKNIKVLADLRTTSPGAVWRSASTNSGRQGLSLQLPPVLLGQSGPPDLGLVRIESLPGGRRARLQLAGMGSVRENQLRQSSFGGLAGARLP
ncbi:transposase [Streptomyces sp. NPDC059629]|uniref:helix-turn-helix domain-containing protein n=1 Tax=Streptomyces sp. NPDC059629 TaxID=3346889 RepID=UPI0036CE3EBE